MEENLSNYNVNVVLMKAGSVIDLLDIDIYEEKGLYTYQQLIDKLKYLICGR